MGLKYKRVVKIISLELKRLCIKTTSPIKAGNSLEIILTLRDILCFYYFKLALRGMFKGEYL